MRLERLLRLSGDAPLIKIARRYHGAVAALEHMFVKLVAKAVE